MAAWQGVLEDLFAGRDVSDAEHAYVHTLQGGQKLTPTQLRYGNLLVLLKGQLQLIPLQRTSDSEAVLASGQAYMVNAMSRQYLFIAREAARVLILPETDLHAHCRRYPYLKYRVLDWLTGQMHDAEQIVRFNQALTPGQSLHGASEVSLAIRFGLERLRANEHNTKETSVTADEVVS